MTDDAAPLVRRFVLHGDAERQQLWAFLKQWPDLLKRGKVFSVVVAEYSPDRRLEQNARMWAGILTPMEKQARMNGHVLPAKSWHGLMKVMFLPELCAKGIVKWKYDEDGERTLTMSTGHLNEEEFDHYLMQLEEFATNELGVQLPPNPRDPPPPEHP